MTGPLPSTVGHLDALTATGGEGWLVISALVAPKKWRSWSFPTTDVDAAAQQAADLDAKGLNVYVRSNLLSRPLTSIYERGETPDTGCAVALAVDLDVQGPGHKNGRGEHPLPADIEAAMSIVANLPPPSLNIFTGGGAHLWFVLDEPEHDRPVELLEEWAGRIVAAGAALGLHVDRPDAARVLRVCGTHRRKRGLEPNLVSLHEVAGWPVDGLASRPWCPTGRYGARDLLEALPRPKTPEPPPPLSRPRRPGEIGWQAVREVSPIDALDRLTWGQILGPLDWSFVGMSRVDGTPVELWKRPGDPASDYSAKCTTDVILVHSDAAGFPRAGGAGYSKLQALAHLHFGGSNTACMRAIRERANARRGRSS